MERVARSVVEAPRKKRTLTPAMESFVATPSTPRETVIKELLGFKKGGPRNGPPKAVRSWNPPIVPTAMSALTLRLGVVDGAADGSGGRSRIGYGDRPRCSGRWHSRLQLTRRDMNHARRSDAVEFHG